MHTNKWWMCSCSIAQQKEHLKLKLLLIAIPVGLGKNIVYFNVLCNFFHKCTFGLLGTFVAVVGVVIFHVGGSLLILVVTFIVVVVVVVMVVVVGATVVVDVADTGSELIFWFKIENRTNPNIPRPRSAPRTSRSEHKLNSHLLCFRVDTCPSSDGLTS